MFSKEDFFSELKWLALVNTRDALANCARRKRDLEQNKSRVKVFWTSLTTRLKVCFYEPPLLPIVKVCHECGSENIVEDDTYILSAKTVV